MMNKVLQKIYIAPEQKALIERLAEEKGISQGELLRRWLDEYISNKNLMNTHKHFSLSDIPTTSIADEVLN